MEILLAVATILGGIAAAWYFWDKYREIGQPPAKGAAGAGVQAQKRGPAKPVVVRAQTRAFCVLMGEDEGATRSALHSSRDIVVSALTKSGARLVETPADTVIAEFDNAEGSVAAVVVARDTLLAANNNAAPENRVHYRFGIDQGKVENGPGGPTGAAVEGAAALGLRAHTDGIQLSEAVRMQLPGVTAFATTPVEGIGHVLTDGAPKSGGPAQIETLDLPLPNKPSIALLPFKVMGDSESQGAALADGLRIDIQNALTKMSGVFLLAAGSANAMRGIPAAEAGPRTGVRHVLEGSVRKSGDQVRVSVELIDTVNNAVVWAERYDRPLADTFALQDEITEKIVTALDVKLSGGEQARVWRKCLINPKAREHFYNGVMSFFRMNAESMSAARAYFERVAELVPDSPLGATWVALTYWFDATRGWAVDPVAARDRAGEWAERAAAMPDADGQAQTVLGNVHLLHRRFDEALAIARQALAIRPGCTNANGFLANVLLHCGEPAAAIVHAKRAIRFMPVFPPWFVEILAAAYRDAGSNDLAIIAAREVPRIAPSAIQGRLILASALVRSGWLADAKRVVREVHMLDSALTLGRFAPAQPYRDEKVVARIVDDLRAAGLPD